MGDNVPYRAEYYPRQTFAIAREGVAEACAGGTGGSALEGRNPKSGTPTQLSGAGGNGIPPRRPWMSCCIVTTDVAQLAAIFDKALRPRRTRRRLCVARTPARECVRYRGGWKWQRVTNCWRGFPTTQMRTAGSGVTAFCVLGSSR
jgi:hypothetical protein